MNDMYNNIKKNSLLFLVCAFWAVGYITAIVQWSAV